MSKKLWGCTIAGHPLRRLWFSRQWGGPLGKSVNTLTNRIPQEIPMWNETVSIPDSKVHGANMGPTWVLSAPDGPHVGPTNLAIKDIYGICCTVHPTNYVPVLMTVAVVCIGSIYLCPSGVSSLVLGNLSGMHVSNYIETKLWPTLHTRQLCGQN